MFKKLGTIEKTRRTFFGSEGQNSFIGIPDSLYDYLASISGRTLPFVKPNPNQAKFQNSIALFKVI